MQGGGGGGGGALVYLGARSAAEAAAVPIANAERASSIFFIWVSPKYAIRVKVRVRPDEISRGTYTTYRTMAVARMQHRGTFDKLLISFNALAVTPDDYSESGAVATDSGRTGRVPSALRCSFHASSAASARRLASGSRGAVCL